MKKQWYFATFIYIFISPSNPYHPSPTVKIFLPTILPSSHSPTVQFKSYKVTSVELYVMECINLGHYPHILTSETLRLLCLKLPIKPKQSLTGTVIFLVIEIQ